jgi:hypothetical protein
MKKLVFSLALAAFSFSAAAYACDGAKSQEKSSSNTQSKKQDQKSDTVKSDQKT